MKTACRQAPPFSSRARQVETVCCSPGCDGVLVNRMWRSFYPRVQPWCVRLPSAFGFSGCDAASTFILKRTVGLSGLLLVHPLRLRGRVCDYTSNSLRLGTWALHCGCGLCSSRSIVFRLLGVCLRLSNCTASWFPTPVRDWFILPLVAHNTSGSVAALRHARPPLLPTSLLSGAMDSADTLPIHPCHPFVSGCVNGGRGDLASDAPVAMPFIRQSVIRVGCLIPSGKARV